MTPDEQKLKERLMRKKLTSVEIRHGPGRVPEDLWEMPKPEVTGDSSLDALLRDRDEAR